MNSRNPFLHWELADYFSPFQQALHYQVRFFPPLIPSPSLQRKYHEMFSQWNMFDLTDPGSCPHRLFSSPCKEWGEPAKGHQMCFTLFPAWKLGRNQGSWVKEKAGYCSKEAKGFSHRATPNQDSSQGRSFTCYEPVTTEMAGQGGEGIWAVLSVKKERGIKLLKFLAWVFCFLFSSGQDIMAKAARTLLASHEAVFLQYRVNRSGAPLTAD